jgi:hypothetical protein
MGIIGTGIKHSFLPRAPFGLGGLCSRIIWMAISRRTGTNGPNGLKQEQPTLVFWASGWTLLLNY